MVTLRFCINFAKLASIGGLAPRVRSTRFIEYLEIWIFHACVVVCRGPRARPANTFLEHYNFVNWCVNATLLCSRIFLVFNTTRSKRYSRFAKVMSPKSYGFQISVLDFSTDIAGQLDGLKKIANPSPGARSEDCILYCIF